MNNLFTYLKRVCISTIKEVFFHEKHTKAEKETIQKNKPILRKSIEKFKSFLFGVFVLCFITSNAYFLSFNSFYLSLFKSLVLSICVSVLILIKFLVYMNWRKLR